MTYTKLRWVTIWLPLLFIIVLEIVEDYLIEPLWGRWNSHLFAVAAVGMGAIGLSFVVFRIVNEADRRLRQQNRDAEETLGYLNAVIDSSGDAIITTDLQGNIQSWNQGAERIYGWTVQEATGQYIPMVPAHLRQEAAETLMKARSGEIVSNFETQRLHKSGALIDVVVTVSPVRDAFGETIGLVGSSKDVSEKKRLEAEITRQQQGLIILEERERIAREMHDGLAQVLGYVNTKAQAVRRFLAVNKLDEAQTHLLQLEDAARDVYADAREAIFGLRSTISRETGLKQTLESYLRNYEKQSAIHTKLVMADHKLLEDFPTTVEVQLIRVIQEALTNVRKHANAEHVCVRIERQKSSAQITVQDDGCGFTPRQTQRGGQPHFGLQTMRERAEGVGGAFNILSTPGAGTRICVTLPLVLPLAVELEPT